MSNQKLIRKLRIALIVIGFMTIAMALITNINEIFSGLNSYFKIVDQSGYTEAREILVNSILSQISYLFSTIAIGLLCFYAANQISPIGGPNV